MYTSESDLHIFGRPFYGTAGGSWFNDYSDAVNNCSERLTWDDAAILSFLSFNYVCGDRTLLKEIRRKPWLSSIKEDGSPELLDIPPHDTLFKTTSTIASEFTGLLYEEIADACRGRDEVYLLLSGGMDSRIAAALLADAVKKGAVRSKITAVTWGLQDSRDVQYAKSVADLLEMEWKHVELCAGDVMENVHLSSTRLGCLVSGLHLHKMSWFRNVDRNALVLAGSYGDSIGRAEYSGKHLLDLKFLQPVNKYGLIRKEALSSAMAGVQGDLSALRARGQGRPEYVVCDYERQGHYMRGMINHAMSIINDYCTVYQVFTSPKVYSYIWSIHPSLRTDDIYAQMLEKLNPRLARMPWARTNRSLSGKTVGDRGNLGRRYHKYEEWVGTTLFDTLTSYLDLDTLEDTGVFSLPAVLKLQDDVRRRTTDAAKYNHYAWLVGLCIFADHVKKSGKLLVGDLRPAGRTATLPDEGSSKPFSLIDTFKEIGRKHGMYGTVAGLYNKVRRQYVIRSGFRKFPVKSSDSEEN